MRQQPSSRKQRGLTAATGAAVHTSQAIDSAVDRPTNGIVIHQRKSKVRKFLGRSMQWIRSISRHLCCTAKRRHVAARRIQAAWLGYIAKRRHVAATRIQALGRRYIAARLFKEKFKVVQLIKDHFRQNLDAFPSGFNDVLQKAFKHVVSKACKDKKGKEFAKQIMITGSQDQMRVWELAGLWGTVGQFYGADPKKKEPVAQPTRRNERLNQDSTDPQNKWLVPGPDDQYYTLFRNKLLTPIQSIQSSGTCAYHTALTVLEYWKALNTGKKPRKIDLSTVLDFLSPKEVFERVHSNRGFLPGKLMERIGSFGSLSSRCRRKL